MRENLQTDALVTLIVATPEEIHSGGTGMEIRWGVSNSIFGKAFLARSPRGITHLSFFDGDVTESLEVLRGDWPNAELIRDDSLAIETQPLHVKGTPFHLKVWSALLEIPRGEISTYRNLAEKIGMPRASRAVGNAIGANRISYLIPCHRVMRADGKLGGYRWGAERKRAMLAAEITPP